MDLDEINNNILKSLSGRFNVPFTGQITAKLLHKINKLVFKITLPNEFKFNNLSVIIKRQNWQQFGTFTIAI